MSETLDSIVVSTLTAAVIPTPGRAALLVELLPK
jgi:hypothetical protein